MPLLGRPGLPSIAAGRFLQHRSTSVYPLCHITRPLRPSPPATISTQWLGRPCYSTRLERWDEYGTPEDVYDPTSPEEVRASAPEPTSFIERGQSQVRRDRSIEAARVLARLTSRLDVTPAFGRPEGAALRWTTSAVPGPLQLSTTSSWREHTFNDQGAILRARAGKSDLTGSSLHYYTYKLAGLRGKGKSKVPVPEDMMNPLGYCNNWPRLIDSMDLTSPAEVQTTMVYLYHGMLRHCGGYRSSPALLGWAHDLSTPVKLFYGTLAVLLTDPRQYHVLQALPLYNLLYLCPEKYKDQLQFAMERCPDIPHYEQSLHKSLHLAADGQFSQSLDVLQKLEHHPSAEHILYGIEYYNAVAVHIRLASQLIDNEMALRTHVTRVIRALWQFHTPVNRHVLRRLLQFVVDLGAVEELEYMEASLPNDKPHITTWYELHAAFLNAMKANKITHLAGDFDHPFRWAKDSPLSSIQTLILDRWTEFHRTRQGHSFERLLPHFIEHFQGNFLHELGIDCGDYEPPHERHEPDAVVLPRMILGYFQDHRYDPEIVLATYNRFRQALQKNSYATRVALYPDLGVVRCFVFALGKLGKDYHGEIMKLLTDMVNYQRSSEVWPHGLPRFASGDPVTGPFIKPDMVRDKPGEHIWGTFMRFLVRDGQFSAADKIMAETWKKWPNMWDFACDSLVSELLKREDRGAAMAYLQRKVNAGFEVSERTLGLLAKGLHRGSDRFWDF